MNLLNSYVSTVFIDCVYEIGYFFSAVTTSKGWGTSAMIALASLLIIASSSPPPPPPDYAWVQRTVSKAKLVEFWFFVIAAF